MNDNQKEVRECPATTCLFYPKRLGKGGGRLLKLIRTRCVDCSGGSVYAPKDCEFDGVKEEFCALFPYRCGKRPK